LRKSLKILPKYFNAICEIVGGDGGVAFDYSSPMFNDFPHSLAAARIDRQYGVLRVRSVDRRHGPPR
jgi:hypothetical protein